MKKINPYIILLIIYLIIGFLSFNFFPSFTNSNFFFATITFVVGSLAFYIYTEQKADEKNNAAKILFLEIKESEKELKKLIDYKISNPQASYPYENIVKLIQNKAWIKYSHLFIKDLNNDEYQQLDEYFRKCDILEKYFEKQHNFFWIATEERARQKEEMGSKMAYDNQAMLPDEFKIKIENTARLYIDNTLIYNPKGITNEINKQLESIYLLSLTPIWSKLKELAGYIN